MSSLTDSVWFWVLLFALMGLVALVAISGKYGRRQAGLERKFQARERLMEGADSEPGHQQDFSAPGETLIPLWPLAFVLGSIVAVAGWMLIRERRQRGAAPPQEGRGPP